MSSTKALTGKCLKKHTSNLTKNILPKMKKMQPNFQEPVVEYCEPDQVIDICSYNHYPVLDKTNEGQEQHNDDNDIYDTSELEH